MSQKTEIYLCKSSQSINEGRIELSGSIDTKEKARKNAVARCKKDWSLFKVYYYAVNKEGETRLLFSYTNPHAIDGSEEPKMWQDEKRKKKKKKKKRKKKLSLLMQLADALFEDKPSKKSKKVIRKERKQSRTARRNFRVESGADENTGLK